MYQELRALKEEWRAWLTAGLPPRKPLTKREVTRRIVLLGRAQAAIERVAP